MLIITQSLGTGQRVDKWHVGEPLPPISGHTVHFTADGDELEHIVYSLRIRQRTLGQQLESYIADATGGA